MIYYFYKGPAMSVAFSKQGDYFASGGQDQQVDIQLIFFLKKYFIKVLVWKTNFDADSPSVDSTSNKYTNGNDHSTTSRNLQENIFQITSLQEKSQPETSDERQARKVRLNENFIIASSIIDISRSMY
jgi:hypothetical protein